MSDSAQGPGWWLASDGRWYPPEQQAAAGGIVPGQEGSAPATDPDATEVMPTPTPTPQPVAPGPAPAPGPTAAEGSLPGASAPPPLGPAPGYDSPPPGPGYGSPPPGPGYIPPPAPGYGAAPVARGAAPSRLRGGARALMAIGGLLAAVVLVTGEITRIFLQGNRSLLDQTLFGIGGPYFVFNGRLSDFGGSAALDQLSVVSGYVALLLGTAVFFLALGRARSSRGLALAAGVLGLVAVGSGIAANRSGGFTSVRELYVSGTRPFVGPFLTITVASVLLLIGGLVPRRRA